MLVVAQDVRIKELEQSRDVYKEFKCFKFQEPLYHKFISVLERFEFRNPKEPFIKLMPRSSYFRYGSDLQRRLTAPHRALINLNLKCELVRLLQAYVLPEDPQELVHGSYSVLSTISGRLEKCLT